IRFKYQLRGFDRDWVEVGARRTAYYQHVPPGIYTFRVTAAMADGEWNVRPAEVLVDVLPAFHQTAWFRSLFFSSPACVAVSVHFAVRPRKAGGACGITD